MKLRGQLAGAGALLFLAGVIAVLLDPDRANRLLLPVAYWAAVAAWAWLATRILAADRKRVALRAIAVGCIVYLLLALVPLAANLETREGFGTVFYWQYARAFYAAVLACTTAWSVGWLRRRGPTCDTIDLLSFPVMLAAGTVAAAAFRHDPISAAIGVAAGCALGFWRGATPGSLDPAA